MGIHSRSTWMHHGGLRLPRPLHRAARSRRHECVGTSSQNLDYQSEVVDRLRLPFPMLSDPTFELAKALGLPTFGASGHDRLYTRLTLVVKNNAIEHVFYPIFPPNTHAQQVLDWLKS
ncbi:MAG: redoxin family protein [Specibacter sp.]